MTISEPHSECEDFGDAGLRCHPYVNSYREYGDNDFIATIDLCETHAANRVERSHGRVRLEMDP
jgi:hypothetical protein